MGFLNQFKIDEFTTGFYNRIDLSGYVLFIENENQTEIVNYIKNNYSIVKETFKLKDKKFILLSAIDLNVNITKQLSYLYPRLNNHFNIEELTFNDIKSYLGYLGNIKTGLLSIESKSEFIQFESTNLDDFKEFIREFLNTISNDFYNYMPPQIDEDIDEDIKLDIETAETVNIILKQLQILNDKGNFLQVLPILEKYLKVQNTVSISELSYLKIDENLSILLPDYNLELKLSHLTKSIYLLFLNHSEGILLSELENYKNELLTFYKNVSNRDDLDKMITSIDDVINTKTNAIYVHLSRVKSAITKLVHPSIAEYYIIDGGKNRPKKIRLNEKLILWKNVVERTSKTITNKGQSFNNAINISNKSSENVFDEDAFWNS
jgi:hypothetical protein